jgi:H+/gluconate symporter-like permease
MVNALFAWVIIPRLDTAVIQWGRSGGGLDALPYNGAVVMLRSFCGLTHRQDYGDIAVVAVVAVAVLLIALAGLIALGIAFGSF